MNFPVTPYFFKKLSIYERIRRGDRLTAKKFTWYGEIALLKWAVEKHEHLYSSLGVNRALNIVKQSISEEHIFMKELKEGEKLKYEDPLEMYKRDYSIRHIRKTLGNLHQRGLAEITAYDKNKGPDAIRFTEEGRMWGDVLLDMEKGKSWKYELPLQTIKLAAILFLVKIIIDSLQAVVELVMPGLSNLMNISCSFN